MLTPKIGVLKDMYNQLRKYNALYKADLTNWSHEQGMFEAGEYFMQPEKSEISLGDHWSTGYDEAHFFRTSFTVPAQMAGKELRIEFFIGGEALVKVNGAFCGSVSCSKYAPERGTIVLGGTYNEGDVLNIELEAAVNSMEFCDEGMDGAKNTEYTFRTAYVWTPDEAGKTGSYTLKAEDFTTIANAVTIDPEVLNKDTEYMMLIPTKTIAVQVRVKYTVTTVDDKLSGGASVVENNITSDEFPFTFDQGKAYTFVLHLGLTSVKLDAEVATWDEMDDYVVNVPNNF